MSPTTRGRALPHRGQKQEPYSRARQPTFSRRLRGAAK
jgi:hypothetical protein